MAPAMIYTMPNASIHPQRCPNEAAGASDPIVCVIVAMLCSCLSAKSGWWKLSVDRLSGRELALALSTTLHALSGAEKSELAAHALAVWP